MKTIIAGSRTIKDMQSLILAIEASGFASLITEVVSGGARGIDLLGEQWAIDNEIPVKRFIPEWERFGKPAGIFRNLQMANYAEALIAIWDGKSKGTLHMINSAKEKGLKVYVEQIDL